MNWNPKKFNIKTNLLLIALFSLLLSCGSIEEGNKSRVAALPFYMDATFTPYWIEPGSAALESFHKISRFQLVNQEGDTITEQTFEGKIYVTDFFFTSCPGICPKMTENMALLQEAFLEDEAVLLLSHSVTPNRDSVPILKKYAQNKGIESGKWHLATGSRAAIYKLGREDYFVEEDLGLVKEVDEFLHTENFVLIDQNRHIRGIYNGLNKSAIKQLIADIETLKAEAIANQMLTLKW